ncbi:MAG TPA: Holliday junction branch migration DNA helicase RuvB [Erysipelotrichaceae bacterium]|nr:Holliday junction branch migration DNA helicase RuvB [Erysipelotrichaceae bacterium]
MSRLLDANKDMSEAQEELSLRPQTLDEYIGQKDLKRNLKVFIGAALHRDEPLDHSLFYGPPGLGKTTLAYIVANEMHAKIHYVSGPALEKPGDLAAILSNLDKNGGDVIFIDEIHRLPRIVEETLYNAMEDFKFSVVINRDTTARTLTIDLPPFTLIGATTRAGNLSSPLRSRFGICEKLDFYDIDECLQIVRRTAKVFNTTIDDEAALEIAKRSRGTPRIANRLFKRVRDFANYEGQNHITTKNALTALQALKIDELGLDDVDVCYLKTIIERFKGGPVGLETLASATGEEIDNLEDVYEPYLLQIGLINRTPRGRIATDKAYQHLKIKHQTKLF